MPVELIPVRELIEKYDRRPAWKKKIDDAITRFQVMLLKIKTIFVRKVR